MPSCSNRSSSTCSTTPINTAEPGSATIVRAEGDATSLVLSVTDAGRGVPPEDLERMFEKFTRLSPGDGRPAGTGLGLAIARGVIEAMGGTIRAESPVSAGHGTRIVITLPAGKPDALLEPLAETPEVATDRIGEPEQPFHTPGRSDDPRAVLTPPSSTT